MKSKVTSRKYCTVCENRVLATHSILLSGVTLSLCDIHYEEFLEQEKLIEQLDIEDYGDITAEY